jgi:DNA-binding transcriptional MerR regulator
MRHDAASNGRTVGEVCALTGVTVRTLHHYDHIGLLVPTARTPAGYRLYTDADVERLHEILLWRELGFGLDEIGRLLDDPAYDRLASLYRQRAGLAERRDRLDQMLAAVDAAIATRRKGTAMTDEDIRQIFATDGDLFPADEYAGEAQQRWGDTPAWRTARERTEGYGMQEWQRIKEERDDIDARFVSLLRSGTPADADDARAAAEAQRASLERWFYHCPPEMHRGLGDLYVDDPRFTAYYERRAPGLARYIRDAIHANADHLGATDDT